MKKAYRSTRRSRFKEIQTPYFRRRLDFAIDFSSEAEQRIDNWLSDRLILPVCIEARSNVWNGNSGFGSPCTIDDRAAARSKSPCFLFEKNPLLNRRMKFRRSSSVPCVEPLTVESI